MAEKTIYAFSQQEIINVLSLYLNLKGYKTGTFQTTLDGNIGMVTCQVDVEKWEYDENDVIRLLKGL